MIDILKPLALPAKVRPVVMVVAPETITLPKYPRVPANLIEATVAGALGGVVNCSYVSDHVSYRQKFVSVFMKYTYLPLVTLKLPLSEAQEQPTVVGVIWAILHHSHTGESTCLFSLLVKGAMFSKSRS